MRRTVSFFVKLIENEIEKGEGWRILLIIFGLALGVRVILLINPEVIHNDGIEYIHSAKRIVSGDWSMGRVPPLYPALIGFFYWLIRDFEIAGILVSVLFGSFIIFPIFYLGKELFNVRTGILASLLASVHPFLFIYSGSVLTESTYYFITSTSVLFGWWAFCTGFFRHLIIFNLFATLSYLTKPEAIGLILIFSLWVLGVHPPAERRPFWKKIRVIMLTLLIFLIFASPYLIKIRFETGEWRVSQKIVISIGSPSKEKGVPTIDDIRKRKEFPLVSLIKDPLTTIAKASKGFFVALYKFFLAFHPLLFIFACLGWVFLLRKKDRFSLKGSLYLLMHFVFFFGVVFPFFWVTRRYTSQMIPLTIPWAAYGLLGILGRLSRKFEKEQLKKNLPALFLILLVVGMFIQGNLPRREHRLIQREVGKWMRENLDRGAKVMSRMPQEAFYADLPWVRIPEACGEEILKKAQEEGVRYLVMDEEVEKQTLGFRGTFQKEWIIPIFDLKKGKRQIMVFEIKNFK